MEKKQSIEKLKKDVLAVIEKNLGKGNYKVFLFGSRARGNYWDRSDIDIGIDRKNEISAKVKLKIEEDLDNLPTLYKFDLIDFKNVSDKFKKEALRYIEPLN